MRPIDADALKKEIDEWLDTVGEATIAKNRAYYGELIGCIKDMPTVERPRGEWISAGQLYGCSNCGKYSKEYDKPFCCHCGAYMRGEGE